MKKVVKIALPSRQNQVDEHFGHCEYFTVFTINENNEIMSEETVSSPAKHCPDPCADGRWDDAGREHGAGGRERIKQLRNRCAEGVLRRRKKDRRRLACGKPEGFGNRLRSARARMP